MKKLVFVVFVLSLLISVAFVTVSVAGQGGVSLSAWASNPPTVDGVIDTAVEWVLADSETFIIGADYSGTLYVMNDDTNLYLAVEIADDDFGTNASTRDSPVFYFDNDHDGLGPEIGDDSVLCSSFSFVSFDQFYQDPSWAWDSLNLGTADGTVAATGDGTHNYFEISHPLNSTDDDHDFSLTLGDTVGFMMRYVDNNAFVGAWPVGASPYLDPSNWHEIEIASPSSVRQGDLILDDNDVAVIEGVFNINGSIIVEENATLFLKNALVNLTQATSLQFNITLRNPSNGNPRLIVSNASLESSYGFKIYFYGNSTLLADDLHAYRNIYFYDSSSAVITNSSPILFLWCYQSSNVQISNSQFVQMRCHDSSVVSISDSNVPNFVEVYGSSNTSISNSTVKNLGTYESSVTEISNCTVTNTYFQGGSSSTLVLVDSEIERFRDWGGGEISISNCTTDSFVAYGSSSVSLSNCVNFGWMNVTGSSIITISDQLTANGTILVEEDATLILQDAEVNFTQTEHWQHGIISRNPSAGNPKLHFLNTTITSDYRYSIEVYANSTAKFYDSAFSASHGHYCWLSTHDSVFSTLTNLTVHGFSSWSVSGVYIFDSTITVLNIYSPCTASLHNSTIVTANSYGTGKIVANESTVLTVKALDTSQCRLRDSTIDWLYAYGNSTVHLVNSTYANSGVHNQSKVFVCWYLNVHVVDSIDQDVPSADVTATYPNATVAELRQTDVNGWATLTLTEKMMNATASYPVGNYTVEANYLTYSDIAEIDMTGNKQIILQLEDFVIPEFPSLTILSLFMTATLLAVLMYRRKHTM